MRPSRMVVIALLVVTSLVALTACTPQDDGSSSSSGGQPRASRAASPQLKKFPALKNEAGAEPFLRDVLRLAGSKANIQRYEGGVPAQLQAVSDSQVCEGGQFGDPNTAIVPCSFGKTLKLAYNPHRVWMVAKLDGSSTLVNLVLAQYIRLLVMLDKIHRSNTDDTIAGACAAGRVYGALRDQRYLTAAAVNAHRDEYGAAGNVYTTASDSIICPELGIQ